MKYIIFLLPILVSCSTTSTRKSSPQTVPLSVMQTPEQRAVYEATGAQFVVATQGSKATEAAKKIIEAGGNIIDAAVAASFVISVERPQSTGLGGGGFMLYREAKTGKVYAIDFRERAPMKATEKMFQDSKGNVIPGKSTKGIFAAGVPGLVAGLFEIHQRFGKLSADKLVQPATELAENGFQVYDYLAEALKDEKETLREFPSSAKIFLNPDGQAYVNGEILKQKDLAKTLRILGKSGRKAFYEGEIAKKLLASSKKHNGLLTAKDFASYKVKWREVVRGTYKGYEILSMPPPSSGGTHVVQILNFLESDSLKDLGFGSAQALHLEASAMQQAFADRAKYMGDPDFIPEIPLKSLTSKSYAKDVREKIDLRNAKAAEDVQPSDMTNYESAETTNFAMMDSEGNVVVSTQTINGWMGSGLVAEGTGILWNNEMDDFSAKPGASNLFGAIGGSANAIAAGKTPLSSMAPTIVLKDGKPVLALGAPGGTRIITCVAQTLLNRLDFQLPLYESVTALRLHHQWRPDRLELEKPGFSQQTQEDLNKIGHKVEVREVPCKVNAVANEEGVLRGVADPRDLGSAWAR